MANAAYCVTGLCFCLCVWVCV